ncbi:MAG TPA: AglZ/HisF2 family acetamidino modification protein [Bacteroidia bacterium]|jgi:cyclase|nr:AglZ/HisF2 family acetamidino modification protein [Bacteroidia bacterium]
MNRVRIIPVLTIDGQSLVKTVKFKKPNYLGDPINAIKIFNDKEVDEIAVLDITASIKKRGPDFKLIEEMASECFMPMAYGGGITKMEEIKILFSLGVEKIILNSILSENENLISQASAQYGSQSILVSFDVKRNLLGRYKASFFNAQKNTKTELVELAKKYESLGAGELILHNVDKDGTFGGLDYNLVKQLSSNLKIPLIACGGINSLEDMLQGIKSGASAIAAGSFFVYRNNDTKSILISYPSQKDLAEKVYSKIN